MTHNHITIRQAQLTDLDAVMAIWHANETIDDPEPSPTPPILPEYPHLISTGKLWIAERGSMPLGFAGAVVRGQTAFLTDLFVHPHDQAAGLGQRLLAQALDAYASLTRFTVSSSDLRALALYTRYGMQPLWPHFLLHATNPQTHQLAKAGLQVELANPNDPQLIAWDSAISGRSRAQDHQHWWHDLSAIPLWISRKATHVGYAYVRPTEGMPDMSDVRIGPVGAQSPADAAAVLASTIHWAAGHARTVRVNVLGPHPALPALLNIGFRISYVETLMLAGPHTPFDPHCYCGSGGALF